MATFLCAWELGGGLGHLMRLKPIAERLIQQSHRVIFIVPNLQSARFLADAGFECMQAPLFNPLPDASPPNSMAEILARRGYSEAAKLETMVRKWTQLIEQVKPDLILTDYAPTANLVSRNTTIPLVATGNGFAFPPRNRWACNLRPWLDNENLKHIEKKVIENVNHIANLHGLACISRVAELFYGSENLIYDLSEIDIYKRSASSYVIKKHEPNGLPKPAWQSLDKIKIAGYLKSEFEGNRRVISALGKMDVEVHLAIPGLSRDIDIRADNVVIHRKPVDLSTLISGANVVLYHGGSTNNDVVLQGKVSLLVPMHLEQFHYAQRMEKNGFGEMINLRLPDLSTQFQNVLMNRQYAKNVEAVKDKYSKTGNWCSSLDIANKLISLVCA